MTNKEVFLRDADFAEKKAAEYRAKASELDAKAHQLMEDAGHFRWKAAQLSEAQP